MIDVSQIRAVRNHNPGNIDRGLPWEGLMPPAQMNVAQAGEHRFCVFVDDAHGFRAMFVILKTYAGDFRDQGKPFTLRTIINRWAPPVENDTGAYVAHLCSLTGYSADLLLTPQRTFLQPLVKGISIHEVGVWAFSDADLDAGATLAGL